MRVLAWPAFRNREINPYNFLLYSHLQNLGVTVLDLGDVVRSPRQVWRLLWQGVDVLHLQGREYLWVLDFLGVPDDGRTDFPVYNPARQWRSQKVGRVVRAIAMGVGGAKHVRGWLPRRSLGLVRRLGEWNTVYGPRPPLPPDLRAELEAYFEEDMRKLEKLLGRTFPHWRSTQKKEA